MKLFKTAALGLAIPLLLGAMARPARADDKEIKVIGPVVKIEMAAPDAKEAVATLRVKGQMVPIVVQDELTLNKFRIKKIQPGDEIRCIYTNDGGKNLSKTFRKTAGC